MQSLALSCGENGVVRDRKLMAFFIYMYCVVTQNKILTNAVKHIVIVVSEGCKQDFSYATLDNGML